jgi:hypothetical protein
MFSQLTLSLNDFDRDLNLHIIKLSARRLLKMVQEKVDNCDNRVPYF